jgi:hypothetical protein
MPRYSFDIDGTNPALDEIGEELPDDEAAWKQATITAGEIFKDVDGKFRPGQEWSERRKAKALYSIVRLKPRGKALPTYA